MSLKKILVSLTVLSMIAAVSCKKKEPEKVFKTVTADTYLVQNPGEKKAINVTNGKVKRGEYLVLGEEKDFNGKKFFNVTIEGVSTKGWIDSEKVRDGKLQSVTVTKDEDLYIRPNLKSDKAGTVKAGQVAFKLEESGEFVLIQFPGKEAYILKTSLGDAGMVLKTISIAGAGKATISASSQYLPGEGKETLYDPRNAFDGKLQTSWCEGKTNDDGVGEYITLTFDDYVVITGVSVVNGSASSEESYNNNNRVATLKIASEDSSHVINLVDNNLDYQSGEPFEIYGRTFRFIINSVHKGKVSDTCISEIKIEAHTSSSRGQE